MSNRWAHNKGIAFYGPESPDIIQILQAHPEGATSFLGSECAQKPAKTERVNARSVVRYFKKIDEETILLYQVQDVDFSSGVPKMLINKMIKDQGSKEIINVAKTYIKALPVYQQLIASKPDVYNEIASWYA